MLNLHIFFENCEQDTVQHILTNSNKLLTESETFSACGFLKGDWVVICLLLFNKISAKDYHASKTKNE